MPRYGTDVYPDNYHSYSQCKTVKAMKDYKCELTGRSIHKGEEHYYLTCWNPVRNKRFAFRFCLKVPRKIRDFYRRYPEQAIEKLSSKEPLMGFFNQKKKDIDKVIEEFIEKERTQIRSYNF